MAASVHVGSLESLLGKYPDTVLGAIAPRGVRGGLVDAVVGRFRRATARSVAAALRAQFDRGPDWASGSADDEAVHGLHQSIDVLDGRGMDSLSTRFGAHTPDLATLFSHPDIILLPTDFRSTVALGPISAASLSAVNLALKATVTDLALTRDELEFGRDGATDVDARLIYNIGVLTHAVEAAARTGGCVLISG